MVKKTLEMYECDRCGKEGQRYTVLFSDGTMVLDRCPEHAKQLEKLRSEPGEWLTSREGRRMHFHKSTMEELRTAVKEGRARSKMDGE